MPPKKKLRWSSAQKDAARKNAKGPKKAHHRGQAPTEAPRAKDRWRDNGAPNGDRPKRVRPDGTEDRGPRTWERREDRGGQRRDNRSDDRGGYQGRDTRGSDSRGSDSRGGYQGRDTRRDDSRGSDSRGGYQGRDTRRDDSRGTDSRGGYQGRDTRRDDSRGSDSRGGYQGRDTRRDDSRGSDSRGGYQGRDTRRDDSRGSDSRGSDSRGGYQGRDTRGSDSRGSDSRGGYQGRDTRGSDSRGSDSRGSDSRGGYQGRDTRGSDSRGSDSRGGYQGRDTRGSDSRGGYQGRDTRGSDSRGSDSRGGYQSRDTRGSDSRGGYQGRDTRSDDRRGGGFERRSSGSDDRRRGPAPRFEREQNRRGFAPRADQVDDPEALRQEADTWTSSARTSASGPVEVAEDNGFAALGLPEVLVERLARDGITSPFPIQEAAIPDAVAGKDVLGRGQTGSGKTLAFGLPMLTRLAGGRARSRKPRALVLVPTRELAMQVSDSLEPLVHVVGLRLKLVAGGLSYTGQTAALDKGVDVLVATPGRLVDLLDRGALSLEEVQVAVLDEADHMADMGFLPSVTQILDDCAPGGQRLLFSATLDRGVSDLVDKYMTDPVTHNTNDVGASVTTMDHHLLLIEPQLKKQITARIAARPGRTLIFARTKLGCERIAGQLREEGIAAAPLHGGLTQSARNKTIGAFRTGTLPVLVATDVAARGIHVDNVSLVMQVDPPADHKDYLHRAGRTARAGEDGAVVTLVLPHQRKDVTRMASQAALEARPIKTSLEDQVLADIGATEPSGVPISETDFRTLVDPRPARRHSGTRGPRGAREHRGGGGGRQGGYRGRPRD